MEHRCEVFPTFGTRSQPPTATKLTPAIDLTMQSSTYTYERSLWRADLLLPLVALVVVLVAPQGWYLPWATCILYGWLFYLCDSPRRLLGRLAVISLLILLGTLPLLLEVQRPESFVGLWGWGISSDSLALFVHISLKAIAAFGALSLLTTLNPIYRLCGDLSRAGLPALFVELVELTYRYIYILEETARQIALAQVSRHGYTGGYRERLGHLSMLLSRTFVLAHSQADQLYDGLVSRGFEVATSPESQPPATPISTDTPLLRLEDVAHTYELGREALIGLSLSVGRGERIALLGANGAGKSTLMKLISGLMPLQRGALWLSGEALVSGQAGMRALRQRIALVFQNSNHQLFCPSVEDEIAFGLKNLGFSGEALAERVCSILTSFDLEPLRHQPPHLLSEGQKKWVSLAAVLATEPDIVLLDEPTASLDRYYTRRVLELLDTLHAQGKTIILSTHDMNLAYDWATRVLVMSRGRLLADASPLEAFVDEDLLREANLERPLLLGRRASLEASTLCRDEDYSLALYHCTREMSALIVGGGRGAWRKASTLVGRGVACRVLAPEICGELQDLLAEGRLVWQRASYTEQVALEPYDLVIAATGAAVLDGEIVLRARRLGLLCSSMSDPTRGNIQFAAQHSVSGIEVAVHTAYRLPEIAQAIRDEVAESLPASVQDALVRLSQLRVQLHTATGAAREELEQQYTSLRQTTISQIKYDWVNRH